MQTDRYKTDGNKNMQMDGNRKIEMQMDGNRKIDYTDALDFIDRDMVCICGSNYYTPQEEQLYIQQSLSILLKVLPFMAMLSEGQ